MVFSYKILDVMLILTTYNVPASLYAFLVHRSTPLMSSIGSMT